MTPVNEPPIAATHRQPVWPFATALALLLVSAAGLVITVSRGEDQAQTWYTSPLFWLGSLTVLTLGLSIAIFFTRRRLGRRMQTALVVSLAVHMMLAIYLKDQVLALILEEEQQPDLAQVEPMPTIPNYHLPAPDQSRTAQPFDRPTEASFDGQLSQLDRQQPSQNVNAQQTLSQLDAPSAVVSNDVPLQRQDMSAPREAPRQSLRRRQDSQRAQRAEQRITAPRARDVPQPARERDNPSPQTASASRRSHATANLRQPSAPSRRADLRAANQPWQQTQASANQSADHRSAPRSSSVSRAQRQRTSTARLSDARAESIASAASSLEFSRRKSQIAPSTATVERRPTSRSTASAPSQQESPIPLAAAAPRVSGRRQVSTSETSQVAMNTPSRSRSQGAIAETTAADVEPARPQRARNATVSAEPSPSALARNSTRGRPASRSRRASAATASDTSMTRGTSGDSALPRAPRRTTAAASSSATSQQRRRQVGAATANQLAQRQIQGLPESSAAASPATMAAEPNIGSENRLARRSETGPAGRGREGTTRQSQSDTGEISRADVNALAGSRPGAAARQGQSGDGEPSHNPGERSGPARPQFAAQIGGRQATADALADADRGSGDQDAPRDAVGEDRSGTSGGSAAPSTAALARSRASLPTRVAAPVGTGGLGAVPAASAGLQDRRASPRSRVAHQSPSRFLRRNAGSRRSGQLAELDGQARRAATPFSGRVARRRAQDPTAPDANPTGAPSEQTEATIERGLKYLARVQLDNGRWSLQGGSDPQQPEPLIRADTAATGLSLLAFLGAGYDHFDGKYQEEVAVGLQWLVDHQRPNGDLFNRQEGPANQGIWLYSHGIAAIALCEAYGMTGDEKLKTPAQRALDFIISAQHPTYGGWRYSPGETPDLSVSGWQLMALRSGQLAGLEVPGDTIVKVRRLLESASAGQAQFVYNPWSQHPRQASIDREPNSVMTSVGLLMRLYSGSGRRDTEIQQGAELLSQRLPNLAKSYRTRSMKNPNRDAYYWYNATQVMFHMQGERWETWREALYPLLAESQEMSGTFAGSWDPYGATPDRWARHAGRLYATTLNLLSLEVYYRHLPLFDDGLAARD